MSYGDNTQYGNPQYNFGNLSPIVEAALQRKKQQAQQQQQMSDQIGKLAGGIMNKYQLGQQKPQDGMDASSMVAQDAAKASPQDASNLRITAYGPSMGEYGQDETIGARDNRLHQGDVAVSPDMASRFPLGSRLNIAGQGGYTVSDFTNPRLHNRVDIWNGQDMGNQPVYGYAQGGVVPLPDNAEGVLGWRTWPDFNARASTQTPEQMSQPQVQHFAGGGVASFTDPYPERRSQYGELGHLADVSGIAGVIAHQRLAQQQMQQENMQQAYKAATQYLQKQQNDDAANAAMYGMQYPNDPYGGFTDPDRVPDYGGVGALAGNKAMQAQQLNQEKINSQQALEYDRWQRGEGGAGAQSDTPNIYTDPDTGEKFYKTSRGGWSHMRGSSGGSNTLTSKYGVDPDQDLTDASQITRIDKDGTPNPSGQYVNIGGTRDYGTSNTDANNNPKPVGGQTIPFNAYVSQARKQQASAPAAAPQTGLPSPQTAAPAAVAPPSGAIELLKQHPELADQFDAKYGAGLSAQILGR